jgi:eukaryotic-like serine/threonine-protein kinase
MHSTTEQLRQLNALLESALELPAAGRDTWLAGLPEQHRHLAPSLRALLARAELETDSFMQQPVDLPAQAAAAGQPLQADEPGSRVGPYRLIRELGQGGMATVWLAERTDGLLQRQVALKLPHDGATRGLALRMARERDILATLVHAHIARLYDAGVTADGRPWLAMEHVAGLPIDQYAQAQSLGLRARVQLFMQVLAAVAHAHARLVVHRDLKPSHILVTAEGEVRLLDFGVASLLQGDTPPALQLTQQLGRAVTPDYAAPEQLGTGAVTVATDVYALGVVLYELLAQQRPYRVSRGSLAELEEAILSADRVLASQRASTRVLARALRGDLDAILDKALRVSAEQRYASVESFAADLQRYLQGEPVLAQRPSRRYRLRKFIARHAWQVAAAGAVAVSLLGGLGVALWQAGVARAEALRAQQVKDFLASTMQQAGPRQGLGGAVLATDLLALAGARIDKELAGDPAVAAELGVIVGHGLSTLGVSERGEATLRAAVPRAVQALGSRHPITIHGRALLAESLYTRQPEEAAQVALALVPDALASLPTTAVDASAALRSVALHHWQHGRRDETYAALHQAAEVAEQHLGPNHRETIISLGLLANAHGRFGAASELLHWAQIALARAQAGFGWQRPHETLVFAERVYAYAVRKNGRPADAVPLLSQVLQDSRSLDAADSPRVRAALLQLGITFTDTGQLPEAIGHLQQASDIDTRYRASANIERGPEWLTWSTALALAAARLHDQALPMLASLHALPKADAATPSSFVPPVPAAIPLLRQLAYAGQHEAARTLAQTLLADVESAPIEDRVQSFEAAALLARLQRQPARARDLAEAGWAQPTRPQATPLAQAQLAAEAAAAWLDLNEPRRAEPFVRQSLALFEQVQMQPSPVSATAWVSQARLHLAAGRAADAEAVLRPVLQAWAAVNPGSPWHGEVLVWLARAQLQQGQAAAAQATRLAAQRMLPGLR